MWCSGYESRLWRGGIAFESRVTHSYLLNIYLLAGWTFVHPMSRPCRLRSCPDWLTLNWQVIEILSYNHFLLNFQPIGSDGTISDHSSVTGPYISDEEYYVFFHEGNTELDSDFFLKEPSSGIGLIFYWPIINILLES